MNTYETLVVQREQGVATVTLNRPDRMNAFTARMREELIQAFDETDADDSVRVVIVTGAGKAFCAGADLAGAGKTFDYASRSDPLREATRFPTPDGDVYRDGGGLVTLRIFRSLKPVIGAVNGAAVGIGATLLLPMDTAVASLPEVNMLTAVAAYVNQGQAVQVAGAPQSGQVRMTVGPEREFIGVGEIDDEGRVAPKRLVRYHDDNNEE